MNLFKKFSEITITRAIRMAYGSVIKVVGANGRESTVDLTELTKLDGLLATVAELNLAADPTTYAETVSATNVITAEENGKTFFLSSATEFVSTLPAPAAGLKFSFVVAAAPTGASYTIGTDAAAQIIVGHVLTSATAIGDSENTAGANVITFVDGQAVVGDRVDVESDGTTWFASAKCAVAAGITFTG